MTRLEELIRTTLPSSVRVEAAAGREAQAGGDLRQPAGDAAAGGSNLPELPALPRLAITTRHGSALVYFQGAHVAAWHPVGTPSPVLWTSHKSLFEPGKPIRGGVPICFPWFGAHASDATAPGHGFARVLPWTLIDAQEDDAGLVTLTMELATRERATREWATPESATTESTTREPTRRELTTRESATRGLPPYESRSPLWPHAFRLRHRIIIGPHLSLSLEVHNLGTAPFTYEEALHTYFAVGDVRDVTVTGLEETDYLDKVAGFDRRRQGRDPIRFTDETDRIYLDTRTTCAIHDPRQQRTITIDKSGSAATVVWNPWIAKARAMPDFGDDEWPAMLCIETCNVNAHTQILAAGESHTMTAVIGVDDGRLPRHLD